MGDRIINITDCSAIEDLQMAQNDFAAGVQELLGNIDNYLNSCTKGFDKTLKDLQHHEKLATIAYEAAQKCTGSAYSCYSSCQCRQRWVRDADGDEYLTPSCAAEERSWKRAQNEEKKRYDALKKIQEKIQKANEIIGETNEQIQKFHFTGSPLFPPGGHALMQYTSDEHNKKAGETLNKILEFAGEYLGRDVTQHQMEDNVTETTVAERFDQGSERVTAMAQQRPDKATLFRNAAEHIRQRQETESRTNNIADPDIVHICPFCHRPINMCVCQLIRERER